MATIDRSYVYVLFCGKDQGFYIGFTKDLKKRLILHSSGKVQSTRFRLPIHLMHYEFFVNDLDAKAREKFLKSGFGRQQLHQILKNTISDFGAEMV